MKAGHPLGEAPFVAESLCLSAADTPGVGIGVLVINYNTARQTLRCLASIQESSILPDWVLVLDNASSPEDYQLLLQGAQPPKTGAVRIYRSEKNLGFAQGSNILIERLLQQVECKCVILLNNDAVAQPGAIAALYAALLSEGDKVGPVGGRMHKLTAPAEVDTLGIALYSSLMPADRKTPDDVFIGPTGGCCMFSRNFLRHLNAVFGYYFDPRFFCYCEDTDLAVRAVLLGYRPVYLDELLALHEGQASSGHGYSSFIAYHGLRNTLWMHVKLIPSRLLWRYGLLLLLAHGVMIVRHVLAGRFYLVYRVYRDALSQLPEFMVERKRFCNQAEGHQKFLNCYITQQFYRKGYLQLVLQQHPIFKRFFPCSKA